MRDAVFPGYAPAYVNSHFAYAVGLGSAVLGLMLLSREADNLIHK